MASDSEKRQAEAMANAMVQFMAQRPEAAGRWLAESGLSMAEITSASDAQLSEILAAAFDFLMSDEELVTEFATENRLTPEHLARARRHLPGGDTPHWT